MLGTLNYGRQKDFIKNDSTQSTVVIIRFQVASPELQAPAFL